MWIKMLYSIVSVVAVGGFLGLGLAVASRLLAVKKDERVEKAKEALPGLNCGACGYPGCAQYAEAIINEGEEITLCNVGGADTIKALGEIMGMEVDVGEKEKMVAQVHCRGTEETSSYQYNYEGIEDCNAAYMFFGGNKVCPYGCLGLGSCIKVCPTDAIYYDEKGLVRVNKDRCISCEECVKVCPTGVMQMVPESADYIVACNSIDKGGKTRKYCSVGCIGCSICVKKSPDGGFSVENFLAKIDYSAIGSREEAAQECPPKCIVKVDWLEEKTPVTETNNGGASTQESESKEDKDKKVVNEKA